jgi:hypothetical protein
MRLIRITTAYSEYIKKLYGSSLLQASDDYKTQYNKFCYQSYGWSDNWTRAFNKLGYECWEPVANIEPLQKKWAEENGFKYDEKNWLFEIQFEQVKKFKPNILFINDYFTFNYEFICKLRENVPSIQYIIGWCGAPYYEENVFKAYDLLLTNLPLHYSYFNKQGLNCKMMRHAFDPEVLKRINVKQREIDFSFLGSIVIGKNFHNERVKLIEFILKKTEMILYSDLNPSDYKTYIQIKKKLLIQKVIDILFPIHYSSLNRINKKIKKILNILTDYNIVFEKFHPEILIKSAKPGVFGLDMYRILASSKITLNQHIDISKGSSNNMRLYEATGMGTCLLTDWSEDLKEKFEDGKEVVSYKSSEELLDRLNFLKNNPSVAFEIGKKGQERTLKENTFDQRAEYLNEIIMNNLRK